MPCTVANIGVGAFAAALAGFVIASRSQLTTGAVAAFVLLTLVATLVYLRGYVIPGTPWLTRRYLPTRFHRAAPHGSDALDPESSLIDMGIIRPCEQSADLCVDATFERAWWAEIEQLRDRETETVVLADVLGVDADRLEIKTFAEIDGPFVAYLDRRDNRVGQWESRTAFIADIAAATVLGRDVDGWQDLDTDQQGTLLYALRVFLDRCPACDGRLAMSDEVVNSCCAAAEVLVVECQDCGDRVFER